jgi:hypothetical protein
MITPPSTVKLTISRGSLDTRIDWVRYTILVINEDHLTNNNIKYRVDTFHLSTNPPNGIDLIMVDTTYNFNI